MPDDPTPPSDLAAPISDAGEVRLGPYRLLREIGRGAQGTVHLAEDTALGRQVAIKVLDRGLANNAEAIARFRREAAITSKLDDPGICAVYATGEDRGSFWIAMRYVEGESLAKKISTARDGGKSVTTTFFVVPEQTDGGDAADGERHGPESSGPKTWGDIVRVLAIFEKTARSLHVAHEAGVIHRDIKPGNLIVTKNGDPVILDFGLAQEVESDETSLTHIGDINGTPAYMSPEQIAAQRIRLDRRTDVYSLGVSLYECLTLKRPFDAPTREGLYQAILTKDAVNPRELNPALPPDLKIVLEAALEKDRDRRYKTALDLAEDLRRVRMREPILAKPAGRLLRFRRWSQRNPALATALAGIVVALVVAVVLLIQVWSERDAKQAALDDYDRLGDLPRLEDLVSQADAFWPAEPSKVEAMKRWLDQAVELEKRLEIHRRVRDRLRASAGGGVNPASRGNGADGGSDWRLASTADQFKYDNASKLVMKLTQLSDPDPRKGLLADIRARLRFAETVEEETIGRHRTEWDAAVQSIADVNECPQYAGLRIAPQLGLVPIGKDPRSGLWEFRHLATATDHRPVVPARRSDGSFDVPDGCGLIFVLLPGGTFWMGSQSGDKEEPNFDPESTAAERPPSRVALDPFFLSKFELTQGQWQWITGTNPSVFADRPGSTSAFQKFSPTSPVENVSWKDCVRVLATLGLEVPTEAQWEYGCRGGTQTPWWTGRGKESLQGAANASDKRASANRNNPPREESLDDGWVYHAPVGSFLPNAFGLHDVHGNVSEWCRDAMSQGDVLNGYTIRPAPATGERIPESASPYRACRGGSFFELPVKLRAGSRALFDPNEHNATIGVRPVRRLVR